MPKTFRVPKELTVPLAPGNHVWTPYGSYFERQPSPEVLMTVTKVLADKWVTLVYPDGQVVLDFCGHNLIPVSWVVRLSKRGLSQLLERIVYGKTAAICRP